MSVYKDKKYNTWRVVYLYVDWTGKMKQCQKRGFKNKRDAVKWEKETLDRLNGNTDMTFASFVERYTEDMKPRLKENTWHTKEHVIRTKFLPYFGKRKLPEIKSQDILRWQNELTTHTDENGKTEKRSAKITPVYNDKTGQSMIGVRFEAKLQKITNPVQLLVQSVYEVEHWIYYVFDSFHMIFAGRVSADDISGPVGIVTTIDQTVEQAAPAGNTVVAMVLVNFAILLSANLGVMNLLPLPALDGGRLVFLIIEAIRRKPIDREKEGMVHAAGMFLLLALMVFIMFNDVRKLL